MAYLVLTDPSSMFSNHLNLPLYDESSFWRGARSMNVSPIEIRGSLNRLHSLSTNSTNRHSTGGSLISVKHALRHGSAVNLSNSRAPMHRHTHHHHPIRSQSPLRYECRHETVTHQDDSVSRHNDLQPGNSCSSSDTESQDRSKIPRYNSQVLGTSTRSLIQQVTTYSNGWSIFDVIILLGLH